MDILEDQLTKRMQRASEQLSDGSHHLVHYTSGQNAINILKGKEFWLRNARCMNDFNEVEHGISLLIKIMSERDNASKRERMVAAFDKVAPGSARKAIELFDGWVSTLRTKTFIGCLGLIPANDTLGKLSMWRAYCPNDAGVALVMNPKPFLAETNELKAYSLPVQYLSDDEFENDIEEMIQGLESQLGALEASQLADQESIQSTIFWQFVVLSMCLKHPSFKEEEEWRIFCLPDIYPTKIIRQEVETIGGIPQLVQKIPLINSPSDGLVEADIPHLLERVIIGPTEYPTVIFDALESVLTDAGVKDAAKRIHISNIPLRGS